MSSREIILGQPKRRLETTFGFYQFWPLLTGFDQFGERVTTHCNLVVSSCLSHSSRQTQKFSQVGYNAVSELRLTTPGNSARDSLTKRVLISWGSSTRPQQSNEKPESHLYCIWQLVTLEAFHLTLNLIIWPVNLWEWHISITNPLLELAQFQEEQA